MLADRLKRAFAAVARAATPEIDYLTTYRARVVSQDASTGKVDVVPDDPRLPQTGMSNLRLKHGLPNVIVRIAPGAFVQVGWDSGNPTKPYAALYEDGATVIKLVVDGTQIFIGGETGAEPAAKAVTLTAYLTQLTGLLISHVHSGVTSGGAVSGPAPSLTAIVPIPNFAATKAQVA